jgi:signal transduction histidine kinase
MISKLQLTEKELALLHQHRAVFISKQHAFAEFIYNSFFDIRETHILIERAGSDNMKRIWAAWFERLFSKNLDSDFVGYLWRIGLRHVEINLDQRFSNLGFSLARRFCHQIAVENFPASLAAEIMPVVDKLIDFCILVETSAYIDATVHCDLEILKGIADKIRNPVTIIGGNLRRLQRHADPKTALFGDYEFLISSTSHCEDMIADINTYMDVFERETKPEECMLETIIDNMLEKLSQRKKLDGVKVEVIISPDARFVRGDPIELRHLFYHILENALDAARPAKEPYVRINSVPQEDPPHTVRIDIFNNGEVINLTNISNILTPFYSTKAAGSGLGLSIVKLVTRKNFGGIDFKPIALEGTRVTITLQGTETPSAK